jgi:hypothetical protein
MKHTELLQKWINGEQLEVNLAGDWYEILSIDTCIHIPHYFSDDYTLRIQPKRHTSHTYIQSRNVHKHANLHLVDSYTDHPNIELVWEDTKLISAKVIS